MKHLSKTQIGRDKEQSALKYLQKQGLELIEQNYYCPFGEIDLIMLERDEIVFIEVRTRSYTYYGNAIESIDHIKQQKLLQSATYYLQTKNLIDRINCRFDVIGFSSHNIDWIKDAFS